MFIVISLIISNVGEESAKIMYHHSKCFGFQFLSFDHKKILLKNKNLRYITKKHNRFILMFFPDSLSKNALNSIQNIEIVHF